MTEDVVVHVSETVRDCSSPVEVRSGRLSFALQVTGIAVMFGTALVGFALWRTGSMDLVWPYLAGQRLLIEPTHLKLGEVQKGQILDQELQVMNLGEKSLRLLGSQPSCGCMTLDSFPIEVEGHTKQVLHLKIETPAEPSQFEHTLKLFSDERNYSVVTVTVSGEVH